MWVGLCPVGCGVANNKAGGFENRRGGRGGGRADGHQLHIPATGILLMILSGQNMVGYTEGGGHPMVHRDGMEWSNVSMYRETCVETARPRVSNSNGVKKKNWKINLNIKITELPFL
jgi:hypothetical protein